MKKKLNTKDTNSIVDLLDSIKTEEKQIIGSILYFLNQEDCFYTDFFDTGYFESLFYDLLDLKILWVTSDNRVQLTKNGENLLNILFQNLVEIDSKKIKFIQYEPKQ